MMTAGQEKKTTLVSNLGIYYLHLLKMMIFFLVTDVVQVTYALSEESHPLCIMLIHSLRATGERPKQPEDFK